MTAIARCPGIFSDRIRRGRMDLIGTATTGRLRFHLFRSAIAGSIVAPAMMRDYTGKDIDGECH